VSLSWISFGLIILAGPVSLVYIAVGEWLFRRSR
jgi:hypothetical protein